MNTLLYDGDCGFCTNAARCMERKSNSTIAVAWQEFDYEAVGLTEQQVSTAAYFIEERADGRIFRGTIAMGRALLITSWPWKVLGIPLVVPPTSWIAIACYPILTRFRHLLPGGTPSCKVSNNKDRR